MRKKLTTHVHVVVTPETGAEIDVAAKASGARRSDAIRELLELGLGLRRAEARAVEAMALAGDARRMA